MAVKHRLGTTQYNPKSSYGSELAWIWVSWIVLLLVLGLLKPFLSDDNWRGDLVVLFHAVGIIVFLGSRKKQFVATVLIVSTLLRVVLMYWDLHMSHIFSLPNSGIDSEMFYYWAVEVSRDPTLIFDEIRGGVFSKLYGVLFWLIGPLRVVAQYTNVLLGISTVLICYTIIDKMSPGDISKSRLFAIISFLPNSLLLSSIFLRESIIAFLIATALLFFIRWFQDGSAFNLVAVIVSVLIASTFHAGAIAVGFGLLIVVTFYRRRIKRFGLGASGIIYGALLVGALFFTLSLYPDLFLGKFSGIDSDETLFKDTNYRGGGSQYLTGVTIDSYSDFVIYGPLRAFYFLASPLPWAVRGFVDALTFLVDALFYIGVPAYFLLTRKQLSPEHRVLGHALMVVIVVSSLVFGAGVSNAGTAVRHRYKLIALFFGLLIVTVTGRYSADRSESRRET